MSQLRLESKTCCFNNDDVKFYTPVQWLQESQWILSSVIHYEGNSYEYISAYSGELFPSSACLSKFTSFPGSEHLYMSVNYSGYDNCGRDGGIYSIDFSVYPRESQIYEDQYDDDLISSEIVDLSLSPDEKMIAFTEYVDDSMVENWHFIIGVITIEGEELFSQMSEDNVAYLHPAWSDDNNYLYYAEINDNQSTIFRLSINSKSITNIGTFAGEICSFYRVLDSEVYLIGLRHTIYGGCDLGLIDTHTAEIYPFLQGDNISILGWETN